MKLRRPMAALAALAMLLASLIFPTTILAHNYTCQNATGTNEFVGQKIGAGTSFFGVQAGIAPTNLEACHDSNGLDLAAGASMWIAIVPGQNNIQYRNRDAILQIGVDDCDDIAYPICDPQGAEGLHWFWADGGCNGDAPQPQPIDNNPNVSTLNRTYAVYKHWSSPTTYYWSLSINGTVKVAIGPGDPAWSHISCWITGDLDIQVMGERWDRGDSWGTPSLQSQFTNIKRMSGSLNPVWNTVNVGACEAHDADGGCTIPGSTGGDDFYIYNL